MLFYRVLRKLHGPFDFAGANQAILRQMQGSTFDIIWLDKAMTISAGTLRKAKAMQPNCRIIGYSLDDMYSRHNQSRRFLSNLPLYDAYFTTKTYNVAELRSLGCPRVEFTGNAFDPHTHRPIELDEADRRQYGAEVGFVGTFEGERAGHINYLAENGVSIQVRVMVGKAGRSCTHRLRLKPNRRTATRTRRRSAGRKSAFVFCAR